MFGVARESHPACVYFAEAAVASCAIGPVPPAWAWKVPDPGVSLIFSWSSSDQVPVTVITGNAVTVMVNVGWVVPGRANEKVHEDGTLGSMRVEFNLVGVGWVGANRL